MSDNAGPETVDPTKPIDSTYPASMVADERSRVRLGAVLVGAVALLCRCSSDAPAMRPDLVLLISLDTVRQDALGVYRESDPSPTPFLDAFANDAVVFTRYGVPVPFTLPSNMSVLTGVYPGVHGVEDKDQVLATHFTTLAEVLQLAGYATEGVVTNLWMKGEFGFARGFDGYERILPGLTYAERVNEAALQRVDDMSEDDQPLFMLLHYMDAHSDFAWATDNDLPYYSPPEYRPDLAPEDLRFRLPDGSRATSFLEAANSGKIRLSVREKEALRDLYMAGVRHLDAQLGVLFGELKRRDLYERSLIIITSDHGEEFGEHGQFIHAQPYQECTSAPLLIKFPGRKWAGRSVSALVESMDLMPTLLSALGLEVPASVQGENVLPLIESDRDRGRGILSRDKHRSERYALRSTRHKLIHDSRAQTTELYDLERDPHETTDLSDEAPEIAKRMLEELAERLRGNEILARHASRSETPNASVLTDEEKGVLRRLGYFSEDE